jgi:hypothetical protein
VHAHGEVVLAFAYEIFGSGSALVVLVHAGGSPTRWTIQGVNKNFMLTCSIVKKWQRHGWCILCCFHVGIFVDIDIFDASAFV